MNPSVPTHHLHISTGFAFVLALFVISFVALMLWFVLQMRKPKELAKSEAPRPRQSMPPRAPYTPSNYSTPRATDYRAPTYRPDPVSPAPAYAPSTPAAPPASGFTAGEGFVGGMVAGALLDSAMHSGHRNSDPAPSYDPSPGYDSGSSSSSSDSGFSYDGGSSASDGGSSDSSSGGFDVSW